MITSDIQELFDGMLGDEQAAELFHALSVSPERRSDFQRHLALQGAMQADRMDSRLTSDEDAAIWGAISGAGVAGAGAGSGFTAGWVAKPVLFVLAGIVGYILGSTEFGSVFEGDRTAVSQRPAASAAPATKLQAPIIVPVPSPAPSALADRPASRTIVRTYPDNGASRADRLAAAATNNGAGTQPEAANIGANNNTAPTVPTVPSNPDGNVANGTTATNNSNSIKPADGVTPPALGSPNAATTTAPSSTADTATAHAEAIANKPKAPTSLDPAVALSTTNPDILPNDEPIAALRADGFEFGASHMLSAVPNSMSAGNMIYANITADASYRFFNGALGTGARIGYGSFPIASVSNDTGKTFSMREETRQLLTADLFANYRIAVSSKLAIGLEGSFGGSTDHSKVGASALMVLFLTDKIALQASGGLMHYWYTSDASGATARLTQDGGAIKAPYRDRVSGTLFDGKYGIMVHF